MMLANIYNCNGSVWTSTSCVVPMSALTHSQSRSKWRNGGLPNNCDVYNGTMCKFLQSGINIGAETGREGPAICTDQLKTQGIENKLHALTYRWRTCNLHWPDHNTGIECMLYNMSQTHIDQKYCSVYMNRWWRACNPQWPAHNTRQRACSVIWKDRSHSWWYVHLKLYLRLQIAHLCVWVLVKLRKMPFLPRSGRCASCQGQKNALLASAAAFLQLKFRTWGPRALLMESCTYDWIFRTWGMLNTMGSSLHLITLTANKIGMFN